MQVSPVPLVLRETGRKYSNAQLRDAVMVAMALGASLDHSALKANPLVHVYFESMRDQK